jgi:hypothetical protein
VDDTTCYRTAGGIAVRRTTVRPDRPNGTGPTDSRIDRPHRSGDNGDIQHDAYHGYDEQAIRDQLEQFASCVETRRRR